MENNVYEEIKREYDRVENILDAYRNKQIKYLNYAFTIIGGGFILILKKIFLEEYIFLFPYICFLVYLQFIMELYRANTFSVYSEFLAKKINSNFKKNIIQSPEIICKYITNFKVNTFYMMNTLIWIIVIFGITIYCSLNRVINCEIGFIINFIVQIIMILSILFHYNRKIGEKERVKKMKYFEENYYY